ncbi:MAG: hypothetical protein ACK56K_09110 [Akkermansiaceae bacterium]
MKTEWIDSNGYEKHSAQVEKTLDLLDQLQEREPLAIEALVGIWAPLKPWVKRKCEDGKNRILSTSITVQSNLKKGGKEV